MTRLADMLTQQALFLSTASDTEINPDVAVKQLESLAFAASQLPDDEKELIRDSIRSRVAMATDEEREILEEMEDNFGL